jgi:crotonobetainyl-CoA:carnitine CoA-transferase CaiB-like acyl-CoA transferase
VPSEWSGTPPGPATPSPRAGEHSRSVLREAGFDDTRIDALLACGALRE